MYIGLHEKYPLFLSNLMKLVFSQQIFKKYSNIKFQGNLSVKDRLFHVGRQTEANSHFSQFCETQVIKPNLTIPGLYCSDF